MHSHQPSGPEGPRSTETGNAGPQGSGPTLLALDASENVGLQLTELGRAVLAELRTSAG